MSYSISFSPVAEDDLARLKRSEPKAFAKAISLIDELTEHPYTGTGKPEPLKGDRAGQWSRRISQKHRLVYEVFDEDVYVFVLSSYGHYDDK